MRAAPENMRWFAAARGVEDDGLWAARAQVALVHAQVEGHEVDRVLARASEQVREAQESPEDLFGPAEEWACDQAATLSQDGATFVPDDDVDPATALCAAAFIAGLVALLFAFLLWLKHPDGSPFSPPLAAVPPLLGLVMVGCTVLRERLMRRMSMVLAFVTALVASVPGVALVVWCFALGQHAPHRAPWLWLVEAAVLFGLSSLAWRLVPEGPTRFVRASGASAVDDGQWVFEARTALRNRGDLTEAQIDAHLDEVAAHAHASGTTLAEEFGNPVGYARTLPGDDLVRWRRRTLGQVALLVLWGFVIASDHHGWVWYAWAAALVALIVADLVRSARKWRAALALRRGLLTPEGGHHA